MGDEQQGPGKSLEHLAQRLGRAQVEVVGRLVHDDCGRAVEDAERQHQLSQLAGTRGASL